MTVFRLGRSGRAAAASCALALAGLAAFAGQVSASGPGRSVMAGTKPAWTAHAKQATAVAPSEPGVQARVWLTPRDEAGLTALAQAVSDPASAQYGQFLDEPAYRAQYAPTADQVTAVESWLTSAGLTVGAVGPDSHYIAVSGSADAVNAAFGTQLTRYVVSGKPELAPATDLSVPDSVAGLVEAVTGLSTLGHRMTPGDMGAPDAFVVGEPCSSFYGQKRATTLPRYHGKTLPYNVCGYTATQLRGAYGVTAARRDGSGATVAITDAFDASTLEQDANTLSRLHGDQPFRRGQFRDVSVPEDLSTSDDCGGNSWYGEQALDVEAVHGMAQGANVLYYGASSCNDADFLTVLAQIVGDNKASIVTNSWGEAAFSLDENGNLVSSVDPGLIAAYEDIFKQGAVQGIGFYFSSGDDGDDLEADGYKDTEFPTSDPWVTSVGGTSLAIGRDDSRLFETGWGTTLWALADNGRSWTTPTFHGGAGGGYSDYLGRPWYQNGVVPWNTTGRAVPDVSMDSDPTTGMLVGETQSFPLRSRYGPAGVHYGEYRIGGTSVGSPLMAGAQAVAQGGRRIGFANPFLYSLASFPRFDPFYDATPQGDPANVRADYVNSINADDGVSLSLRTFDEDSSLFTTRGWDDVTGVGSVTKQYLELAAGGWRP